jgi:hypothetical protein
VGKARCRSCANGALAVARRRSLALVVRW